MISLFFSLCMLILGKADASQAELCPITSCDDTVNDGHVEEFCKTNGTWEMNGRCCISNYTVIGLDLRSCGIKNLNITGSKFADLIIMDLQDNNIEKMTKEDLIGLVMLNFLYLPPNIQCPGDLHAWGNISHTDNTTSCYLQENPCQYLNISDIENGQCIHTGPGSAKCVCLPGHYGYKCMNEGEFPTTTFLASLTACTLISSIVLWFLLGRDSYKKS